jgi:uncharacterized protein (DUF362 family)
LYRPAKGDYKATAIPRGITLKEARIPADILACDCLINMPVAKVHSASGITVAMKNWMGSVDDRRPWHREGLHQCIADYCTAVKPHLVIVDATRILMSKGPQGPGDLAYPNEIIFSTDIVAADAYAATLLKKTPMDIGYIRIAQEMGLGCADLTKMQIERVEA